MASCQQGSRANKGHAGLNQLKVMSSIEACRTEALGGHVAACTKCNHQHIAYNSCKNRHCPKCQGPAARDWTAARSEDLLPVEYFHVARVSDLLCMSNLAHASKLKEHDDNDDIQGSIRRAAERR